MNITCHYYAVLALCRTLGFSREAARIIAYSSEYVDEAYVRRVSCKENDFKMGKLDTVRPVMIVQTYSESDLIKTLVPFHFVPALKGDSEEEKMRTCPDSPFLGITGEKVLKEGNIYLLGIFLHVYADSWSHQGFSGIISPVNSLDAVRARYSSFRGFGNRTAAFYMAHLRKAFHKIYHPIIPNYSHSQAGTLPDLDTAEWSYSYDEGKKETGLIDNKQRFKQAFMAMQSILEAFLEKYPQWAGKDHKAISCNNFYRVLAINKGKSAKVRAWRRYLLENELYAKKRDIPEYDPSDWLKGAFPGIRGKNYKKYHLFLKKKPDRLKIENSDWYEFVKAVKAYKKDYIAWMRSEGMSLCC